MQKRAIKIRKLGKSGESGKRAVVSCTLLLRVCCSGKCQMKNADGSQCFLRLFSVAKVVLTIPHSNAAEERIFSMIRKNKTCFRPNLDPIETLSSIISVKLAIENKPIHKIDIPDEILRKAKKATNEMNIKS